MHTRRSLLSVLRGRLLAAALTLCSASWSCGGGGGSSDSAEDTAVPDAGVTWPNRKTTPVTEQEASTQGPYTVASYNNGYPDSPNYAATDIYYPSDGEPPYAAIAMVPGFVFGRESLAGWAKLLASHGIVAMNVDVNSSSDSVDPRKLALWDALGALESENERAGSPLFEKIATDRLGLLGWSMGGGAAMGVAEDHPELRAVVSLCPWYYGHSFASLSVPTLLLGAERDSLAGGQAQAFYESMAGSAPKLLWVRAGASHFDNQPTQLDGALGRYGLAWLKVFLEGDERYRAFLLATPPADAEFRSNLE